MKNWFCAAGIRCIKTICQTAVATIGTAAVLSQVDWKVCISASVLAGILSLLTSVAGLPELDATDREETDRSDKAEGHTDEDH